MIARLLRRVALHARRANQRDRVPRGTRFPSAFGLSAWYEIISTVIIYSIPFLDPTVSHCHLVTAETTDFPDNPGQPDQDADACSWSGAKPDVHEEEDERKNPAKGKDYDPDDDKCFLRGGT